MELHDIRQMTTHEVETLYDAHRQYLEALPRMKEMASLEYLRECLESELAQAEAHTSRLESIFDHLGADTQATDNPAVQNILGDLDQIDPAASSPAVVDAKLIDISRKINLYHVAAYGTLSDIAEQMRMPRLGELCHDRLHECDRAAEKLLNAIPEVVFA